MKTSSRLALLALLSALLFSANAFCGTITLTPDTGWTKFGWNTDGHLIVIGSSVLLDGYTVDVAGPTYFRLVDAYYAGDTFQITIDGNDYSSSVVSVDPVTIGGNPDAAWNDPRWSSFEYLLSAGDHTIEITRQQWAISGGPIMDGSAFLSLESSSVPEPATAGVAGAFLMLGLLVQRKLRKD